MHYVVCGFDVFILVVATVPVNLSCTHFCVKKQTSLWLFEQSQLIVCTKPFLTEPLETNNLFVCILSNYQPSCGHTVLPCVDKTEFAFSNSNTASIAAAAAVVVVVTAVAVVILPSVPPYLLPDMSKYLLPE